MAGSSQTPFLDDVTAGEALSVKRYFTTPGQHAFDTVQWETRDARIAHGDRVAFEQCDVEFPKTWSQNATNIVAQKYFRGQLGSVTRESSVKQMIGRVAGTIADWGRSRGYFASVEDGDTFETELAYILVHQMAAFNSPVWFNVGFEESPQASACFILSVEDTMDSILDWNTKEGRIFLGGSGSGVNLSNIRGSMEPLSKGGTASGPVSFMRGADSWAGTIKSGGKTRRAAKMVVLDIDHPDIREFIWCKAGEEKKANALRDAGFDMSIDGEGFRSIQYQNANNSVRLTDDFMRAVEKDQDWHLIARSTGQPIGDPIPARTLMHEIADAAWQCADPGVQYDTTINQWHTCPKSGRINASNPCCFLGDTPVRTSEGPIAIAELARRAAHCEPLPLVSAMRSDGEHVHAPITQAFSSGLTTELCHVHTEHGERFSCTPEHRFMTTDGSWTQARDLNGRTVRSLSQAVASSGAATQELMLTVAESMIVAVEIEHVTPTEVYDLEIEGLHNFAVGASIDGPCPVVHNSEYMHVDDSACNLASLNLMKFRRADGSFDVPSFEHTVDIMLLAQEILVGPCSYPTEQIGVNARAFRQLGLGYANLGALLMSNSMAYDSDAGRGTAAAITSLMTGRAYHESARIAAAIGPYERYSENAEAHNAVMRMHRDASAAIPDRACPDTALLSRARDIWQQTVALGEVHGYRNAQATVLAPTGCLVEGSLVSTSRGLVRLRSLGDVDGSKWQDLDVQVATDDGPRDATKFYVNGMEQVVSVQTARGYRIQGTPTHRVKVVDAEGEWVWKRMAELAEGDRVPMMLNSLVGEPQAVALPPLGDLHWNSDHLARVPRKMTADLAELVGYFMGDGSLHAKGIRLCVTDGDDDVRDRLIDLADEIFGLEAHALPCTGYTELALHSVPLTIWWDACGFAKHRPFEGHSGKGWSPHIPDAILHSNDREVYAAFLRGLFEADGSANHGYAYWSTTNEEFSRDVQTLMLALGFVTTRGMDGSRVKWGAPCHRLRLLNAATGMHFAAEIGFMSSRKNEALLEAEHPQAARYDHIPVTRALVDELAPVNDPLRKTMLMSLARSGTVSRRSATALAERAPSVELDHLLSYFYDAVASTELLDDQPTFDLSVPDNVTYVANGFISHNTISFLMDCDTTGVEPDFSLVKFKELVGGGQMTIVNKTIPMALRTLKYSEEQIEQIAAHIDEHATIVGAPGLSAEHLSIFDVAVGERAISHMGHIKMMGAVQPFISGAISKCVAGDTLIASDRGLTRIGALHNGERPDSFRDMDLTIASLDGRRRTDAFYYGGTRPVRQVTLRSGHKIVGTENHRLLTCGEEGGLVWRRLDELQPGEYVATQYGDDLWSAAPSSFADFVALPPHGSQKTITVPSAMTERLAFFLGAYVAEGHIARSNHTVRIANADESVIARLVVDAEILFGFTPRVYRQPGKCPSVDLSSKRLVEFLDYLGCGERARTKRIPDAVLRSPRNMVLAFVEGLCLDAYVMTSGMAKWAICLDSPQLLDDLQAVLTNLGVVHGRVSKYNKAYDKSFDEVYCCGREAQRLIAMISFIEVHKQRAANELAARTFAQSSADIVPGITGTELYELIPLGRSGHGGVGTSVRPRHRHLVDPRTKHVSRESVARLAQLPGVELPEWLGTVLERNLHFSPVALVADVAAREVYDVSVPVTHAFVANGIVNHNTVNLPYEATVEDIADAYVQAWHCGVKALAIYRDGSKTAQALRTDAQMGKAADGAVEDGYTQDQVDELIAQAAVRARETTLAEVAPKRNRMPRERQSITHKFSIAGHEGYITAGMYEDGTLGEIFLTDIGKEGSTLRGLLNSFATSISIALQYGVPLEKLVEKFSYMRFEPEGITQNPEIPFAKSMPDYIMRWLASRFLDTDIQEELGIMTPAVRARKMAEDAGTSFSSSDTAGPANGNGGNGHGNGGARAATHGPMGTVAGSEPATTRAAADAMTDTPPVMPARMRGLDLGPACAQCGGMMQRTGSCYTCSSCGNNTGCG